MKKYLSLMFVVLFSISNSTAQDTTANEETVISFPLGSFIVSTLSEGAGDGNPGLLKGTNEDMLKKYLPLGSFKIQTNAFLIRTENKNVLIDTGYGRNLFTNLYSLDVKEDQINIILLTHMHGDHIGGLLKDGKAAFPNAELYVSKIEHDHWMASANNANIRAIFEAYKSKLHLFEPTDIGSDKQNLFEGFQGIKTYGHTPGHTAFMIESDGARLLIWGDITHATEMQMPNPKVTISFDVDADMARESRLRIMEYVAKTKIRIGGMHIIFPSIGNIRKGSETEGEYVFIPVCDCESI